MAKTHPIEAKLSETLSIKRGAKESDKSFAKKLYEAAMTADEGTWESLGDPAQKWVNAYDEAVESKQPVPTSYDIKGAAKGDPAPEGETESEGEAEEVEGKPAKAKKTAAGAPAKAGKGKEAPAKETAPKATKTAKGSVPKKAAKPKGKAVARPAKGASEGWTKTLADIGKKGKEGATGEEIEKICDKHGVRPFFARFVRGGFLKRVDRGVYALTAAGEKLVAG